MEFSTHLDHIGHLYGIIWYKLVEWMDLPSIYHKYSLRSDHTPSYTLHTEPETRNLKPET